MAPQSFGCPTWHSQPALKGSAGSFGSTWEGLPSSRQNYPFNHLARWMRNLAALPASQLVTQSWGYPRARGPRPLQPPRKKGGKMLRLMFCSCSAVVRCALVSHHEATRRRQGEAGCCGCCRPRRVRRRVDCLPAAFSRVPRVRFHNARRTYLVNAPRYPSLHASLPRPSRRLSRSPSCPLAVADTARIWTT